VFETEFGQARYVLIGDHEDDIRLFNRVMLVPLLELPFDGNQLGCLDELTRYTNLLFTRLLG